MKMKETGLPQLVARINRIAELNDDTFRITIEVRPTTNKIWYDLEVFEAQDRHTLARASGSTIAEAAWYVQERIGPALEQWGYVE